MRRIGIIIVQGAMAISTVDAAADPITLMCSSELSTWGHQGAPPLSTITDQTMVIDLESGRVTGIIDVGGVPLKVIWADPNVISFSGPTLFGLDGSGVINRLSGALIFMAPPAVQGQTQKAQVMFQMRCRPARAQF
jgi:hypothetical protein